MLLQDLANAELDVTTLYTTPAVVPDHPSVFGFCELCKHGQLEYKLPTDHYKTYNLLTVGQKAGSGGGNAPLRKSYYRDVVSRLSRLCAPEKFLDIGCGYGTIMELAGEVFERVKGIEASASEAEIARSRGLEVVNSYFDQTWSERDYSAVVMTQVLEHLPNPREVLEAAYQTLRSGGAGYVDVPNGYRIYAEGRYSDVYAEHINYWSINSLTKILGECGFVIHDVQEIFSGHHIAAFFTKPQKSLPYEARNKWDKEMIREMFNRYERVSVWGAGIKGRIFIKGMLHNMPIAHVYDSAGALEGLYAMNCPVPIELPTKDSVCSNDAILITATEYKNEIISTLRDGYGFCGTIAAIDDFEKAP